MIAVDTNNGQFDPAAILEAHEGNSDLEQWSVIGLVMALKAAIESGIDLTSTTETGRVRAVRQYVDELTSRGIDGESVVRYGLTIELVAPVAVSLAMERVFGPSSRQLPDADEWRERLELDSVLNSAGSPAGSEPDQGKRVNRHIAQILPRLIKWANYASLDSLVTLSVPTEGEARRSCEAPDPDHEVTRQYRWLVERLTQPDLSRWSTSAIELEYRWNCGALPAPCPHQLMTERQVRQERLAIEYANRRLLQTIHEAPGAKRLEHQVYRQAKSFLRDRRHTEAAALFEFLGGRSDGPDPASLNNQGFCLVPVDPLRALHYLDASSSRGYTPAVVNAYNRMCCHLGLANNLDARLIAEYYWSEQFEPDAISATIWLLEEGDWRMTEVSDVRISLASLALHIAETEGWPDRRARWSQRLTELRNGSHVI
ncbi:hypothetical protein [Rhodococcus opacus]|uniref:hypothetical protein n=1 Tax=Rhodococcus opacus TaxID=37919 RepID=UPI0029495DF2|nr:hypothetical protein [Rhodococcus opacus]MDV6244767.1 hypothetical protein [Rhodococcus opacus]